MVVLLDKVIDPQNFGAIIRTCFYYGVDYLIVNKTSRPTISPAICQVSLGTSELLDLYCLKNFNSFVRGKWNNISYKSTNYPIDASDRNWKIIATTTKLESSDKTNNNRKIKPQLVGDLEVDKNSNILIIFGSEFEGLSRDIIELTDFNVIIPPNLNMNEVKKGSFSLVDSLNVGVSTGIIIHTLKEKLNK